MCSCSVAADLTSANKRWNETAVKGWEWERALPWVEKGGFQTVWPQVAPDSHSPAVEVSESTYKAAHQVPASH